MSSYDSFIIESITHEETSSSGIKVDVLFKEWKEITPEYGELKQEQVAKPEQASTVDRGKQTGVEPKKKGSILHGGYEGVKGWMGGDSQ